jgi:hypothetical protein
MATSRTDLSSYRSPRMAIKAAHERLAYVAACGPVQCFDSQFRGARKTEDLRSIRYMACYALAVIERFEGS